jgi:hypothetical protein
MKDPNNLLMQGPDGKFAEMADKAGVASVAQARGGAVVDFNLDGLVDLLVVNRNSRAEIWRNATSDAGNWIALRLSQPGPNRDGVGAVVEVRAGEVIQRREITSGGGHVSGHSGWIHAGIGAADKAEVRVRWPGEGWSPAIAVPVNGFAIIEKSAPAARLWEPPR